MNEIIAVKLPNDKLIPFSARLLKTCLFNDDEIESTANKSSLKTRNIKRKASSRLSQYVRRIPPPGRTTDIKS